MERRVAPPAYQTTEGGAFKLNLSCMMDGIGHDDDAVDAIKAIDILAGEWPSDVLQEVTTLDQSQLLAVQRFYGHTQAALSQELALIQGPPGTGKTYVGIQVVKALLANTSGSAKSLHPGSMDQADSPEAEGSTSPGTGPCIGPVLIVCFTNHALDQFLEGLLAAGLTDMVRVGGRSKNDNLAQYNIHELVQGTASAAQRQLLHGCYVQAGTLQRRIDELKTSLMQG
ncbi:NFX1-type zinc finger-containing protein 1 [Hypocenomyce scalaris]|nr:NFX1-type zinc finger-containing protein 1 [Hypocenomyce scalaris]